MKDYYTVTPHKTKLMQKHYTPGRGGRKIRYITRHHTAGILNTNQVWDVWQTRQASAHYIVEVDGQTGQLVWDRDTAWSNGNQQSNQESITIEHSNNGGAPGWPISDATVIGGARLAAALCRFYGLGRPEFGKNIRDHREFYGTSCPHHLANGGKYHQQWMNEAQRFYDLLEKKLVTPTGEVIATEANKTATKTGGNEVSFTEEDRQMLREVHHELTYRFQSRYRDENGVQSDYRETLVGHNLDDNRKLENIHADILPWIIDVLVEIHEGVKGAKDGE